MNIIGAAERQEAVAIIFILPLTLLQLRLQLHCKSRKFVQNLNNLLLHLNRRHRNLKIFNIFDMNMRNTRTFLCILNTLLHILHYIIKIFGADIVFSLNRKSITNKYRLIPKKN